MLNSGCGCNRRNSFFEGYETFWIIVVIAIVVIWVHYSTGCGFGNRGCGCGNNGCGCGNNGCGCGNNACDACMNPCNSCGCM